MQQSELALFAQEFRRVLTPLLGELELAAARLGDAAEGERLPFAVDDLAAGFGGLAAEFRDLLVRIEAERSTVFVFGPPKAGKSTLLAALAGARVAEVSILPAYPCVLRARHAPSEAAALQRFDGSLESVAELGALELVLQRAHAELVTRVRAARERGEAFDAARHLPGAVRRVERTQSAAALAHAALELVECPSIHGPLFPDYAEMLIGEPDHARAAVFVVRAGQLADEASFDGIEALLEAFEHPLLVLNLDERSRELSRAGELAGGVERESPARLVAAFEELSACEALVSAIRSGRMPVLALDLLSAARARLQGEEEGPASRAGTRFADLARELSAILDTHPALRALAGSALRRAAELGGELRVLLETPGLAELPRRSISAAQERATLDGRLQALERLARREPARWEAERLFDGLRAELAAAAAARAKEIAGELAAPLARAVEDWFTERSSLRDLLEKGLGPRLAGAAEELARASERWLRTELGRIPARQPGDARLSATVQRDLDEGGVNLARLLASAGEHVRASLERPPLRLLDYEAIPVRAKLAQRLALRDATRIRRELLGPPEAPNRGLDSAVKGLRLGPEAREAMKSSALERAAAILAEGSQRVARALGEALLAAFRNELSQLVERERARLAEPLQALQAREAELRALAATLGGLAPAAERVHGGLAELSARFEPRETLVPSARPAHRLPSEREAAPVLEEG